MPAAHGCGGSAGDAQEKLCGQRMHATLAAGAYQPAAQGEGAEKGCGHAEPAVQLAQAAPPATLKVPGAHGSGAVRLPVGQKKPLGHGLRGREGKGGAGAGTVRG